MSELLKAAHADALDMAGAYEAAAQLRPYRWVQDSPGSKRVRPECREHGRMKWAMKISKDYPPRPSKHTMNNGRFQVWFMGLLVQIYKCPAEGCTVEVIHK